MRFGLSRELARRLELGASLAVSGVCLTVAALAEAEPAAEEEMVCDMEVSPETLRRTTLGDLRPGDAVNLEPALAAGDAMGGHWVQGHVDGVISLTGRREVEGWRELAFELPAAFRGWVVEKGSVTLDGVSLTVSRLTDSAFEVALVPHTLEVTQLDRLEVDDRVNFEADILAKYVERSLAVSGRLQKQELTS